MFVCSPSVTMNSLPDWLMKRNWTTESIAEWQQFYNHASRRLIYGQSSSFAFEYIPHLPTYKDLKPPECKQQTPTPTPTPTPIPSSAIRQSSLLLFTLISLCTMLPGIFFMNE